MLKIDVKPYKCTSTEVRIQLFLFPFFEVFNSSRIVLSRTTKPARPAIFNSDKGEQNFLLIVLFTLLNRGPVKYKLHTYPGLLIHSSQALYSPGSSDVSTFMGNLDGKRSYQLPLGIAQTWVNAMRHRKVSRWPKGN